MPKHIRRRPALPRPAYGREGPATPVVHAHVLGAPIGQTFVAERNLRFAMTALSAATALSTPENPPRNAPTFRSDWVPMKPMPVLSLRTHPTSALRGSKAWHPAQLTPLGCFFRHTYRRLHESR